MRLVNEAWRNVRAEMRQLDRDVTMRPVTSEDIFIINDDVYDGIHFDVRPVVLSVPEKIGSSRNSRLYVVIKGKIVFEPDIKNGRFTTSSFGTNIGYFRESNEKIRHVYGAHFDFEPSGIAHPVFHSQIAPHAHLFDEVRKHHHGTPELEEDSDLIQGILRNVRLPTAQMDFFAVLLQVCSDHLINETTGTPRSSSRSHYNRLKHHCSFFTSYGANHSGMRASIAAACHRSPYWYDHALPTSPDGAK